MQPDREQQVHTPLAENHERIWLEPLCCVDERCWCQHPQPCDDCDMPPIEYIRADLVADMLTALKAVVSVADRKTVEFDLARAAIAKAEGRNA